MTRHLTLLSLVLSLAACGEPAAEEDTSPVYDPNPPEVLAEATRPAVVVLPDDYSIEQTYPLVLMLHGYGANATMQDVIFQLKVKAEAGEMVLVTPEGLTDSSGRQFWNAATECCDFDNTDVDDVGYISGLIEEARELYPISHVAIVGHSNGGFMAHRMACERPDLVDRIAPLAGTLSSFENECPATQAVRVLHMHGTADETIAYNDGGIHLGAESSIAFWAELGGCTGPIADGTRDHHNNIDGEETDVLLYDCPIGDMQLWRANGGDHIYLGSNETYKRSLADWLIAP
ncbi:MAG: alpha/beta fold hydrolase [Deltaproteobacteria bacterium]|nr:MAG: alpha/beta fold hydrolase [Deltaproteobacteria bacterium]